MHWPTITTLAGELRLWNENTEFASPVFFIAWPSSDEWTIDTHPRRDAECTARGHIPGYKHRFNARELARQLLADAKASCGGRGPRVAPSTRSRPYFTQAGTDDYAPETQRFYPQFYTSDRLNGLDGDDEFSEPEEGDITTGDHQHWYQYGKLYFVGDEHELRRKMNADRFWPSVWFISDHGNAHLMQLNGLGTAPEPLGCPRCHAELQHGQNCPYCARDGIFVLGDRKGWVDEAAYDYKPDPKWLPTRWEADVMAIPVTPPPAPYRPPARTPRRTTRTTRRRR